MTITGHQVHEARALLGLQRNELARAAKTITTLAIIRAEESEDEPTLSPEQAAAIRQALERAGVEFTRDGGVRLRKSTLQAAKRQPMDDPDKPQETR